MRIKGINGSPDLELVAPGLTERQKRWLYEIAQKNNQGVNRSFRDIRESMNTNSVNGVSLMVRILARKGYVIRCKKTARSVLLTKPLQWKAVRSDQ